MTVNSYFQTGNGIGNTNEKTLYEDLIIESLQIYGFNFYYMPRTLVNRDLIYNEDSVSKFEDAYTIEGYFETTEGFTGQQELISKFGLEIRDDTTFVISKRRFNQVLSDAVLADSTRVQLSRPQEGDIIYLPLMKAFFEISFVEDQEPFFQLSNLPVYKLRVTRWEYSSEKLDTGVSEIDAAEDSNSLDTLLYQFQLENQDGSLQLESDGAGDDKFYLINEQYNIQTQSTYANNLDFINESGANTATLTDDIIDFSESNPFSDGEPI